MEQHLSFRSGAERRRSIESLSGFVTRSIDTARAGEAPFHHLVFDRVFPDDVYAAMLTAMPVAADYRPMSGRSKGHDLADGTHTRVKIDLFPEYIRSLPVEKRGVWDVVGRALCSQAVKQAFVRRLAPGLQRRFGTDFARIGMAMTGIGYMPIRANPVRTAARPGREPAHERLFHGLRAQRAADHVPHPAAQGADVFGEQIDLDPGMGPVCKVVALAASGRRPIVGCDRHRREHGGIHIIRKYAVEDEVMKRSLPGAHFIDRSRHEATQALDRPPCAPRPPEASCCSMLLPVDGERYPPS